MDKNNLPVIYKEKFFVKIKNIILGFLKKNEYNIPKNISQIKSNLRIDEVIQSDTNKVIKKYY